MTTLHVALFTGLVGEAVEISGGGYARVPILYSDSDGTKIQVTWPTATSDWGDITEVHILDGETPILIRRLPHGATIREGDTPTLPLYLSDLPEEYRLTPIPKRGPPWWERL